MWGPGGDHRLDQEEDLEHFKTSFDIFDQDDSGKISYTEMDGFIRSLTENDKEPNEEETLLVSLSHDKGQDGFLKGHSLK